MTSTEQQPCAPGERLGRSAATISALTFLSRLTGFARMLVVAAVLGTTFLGNTYQMANSIPNLVFELFAAGALQAVLVPALVTALARHGRADADRLAGALLGTLGALLVVLVAAGAALSPVIARLLFAGVADPEVRAQQVQLGTVFLLIFLPQVIWYAVGTVATALLHAERRFTVPAVAPVLNNVVVIGAYLGFRALREGRPPSLELSGAEIAVLAGGTTLGVVVFCSAPLVAVRRLGYRLRPRFAPRDPALRLLARTGAWAAAFLGLSQVLLVAVLVLGNSVEGGVVAYQLGYTFFLLPHALVAVPLYTAAFPGMAQAAAAGEQERFAALTRRAARATCLIGLLAAAVYVALAEQIARVALFGEAAGGVAMTAGVIAWLAPGLVPYGLFLLLARAAYAQGDARLPTLVQLVATGAGLAAMVLAAATLGPEHRVAGLAAAYSGAQVLAAVALAVCLRRRLPGLRSLVPGRTVGAVGAVAVSAAAAMAAIAAVIDPVTRPAAASTLVVAGLVGSAVYATGLVVLGVLDREVLDPRRLVTKVGTVLRRG